MDTTKSHGFFLASFLVLVFLGDLTEACSCTQPSVREACCKHHFVIRVRFMGIRRDPDFPIHLNIFTIQLLRVFKGRKGLRNKRVLYSPKDDFYCGYHHKGPFKGDDYLISGMVDDIGPQIGMCHLAIPWEEVPLTDKMNLEGVAAKTCSTICPQG